MMWVYLSVQLEWLCNYIVIFGSFCFGFFFCRIYWEFGLMFISSVKMAFSTNFISASCVKLNKFNFIIFFKTATEFILIILTALFGVNFPLCKNSLPIHKWQDCLIWIILLVLMGEKCLIFYLWRKILAGSWS